MVWLVLAGLAACGDNGGRTPKSIILTPNTPQLPVGTTVDVTASYMLGDNSTNPATDVTWSSADTTIATVTPGAAGHATIKGVKIGSTTVTAEGSGLTGTITVTVTAAALMSIGITPAAPSLAAGTSAQLTATGVYTDASTVDLTPSVAWSSSATAFATVDATGLLHGVKAGSAKITAALGSVKGTVNATVTAATLTSIEVTPLDPSLAVGITQQFTATGVFSDSSTQDLTAQVTWSSDAEPQATVSATGLVTAVALGTATITATRSGISGSSHVTVSPAVLKSIAIDPPAPKVALGLTLQLTATGTFTDGSTQELTTQVTWASATETVATVSTTGLVTSLLIGTTQITATKDGITGTTALEVTAAIVQSIQVTPVEPTIAAGTTLQFTATGTFSDLTTQNLTGQVTWTSSDTTAADISNADPTRGLATSTNAGTTTITATFVQASGNVSGATTLHVSNATLASIQVTAVATPPVNPSLAKGLELQFIATGVFTDNSTQILTAQVTWDSSDPAVAAISNATGSQGLATALAEGTTTITATFVQASGNVSGSTLLTVTPAVLLGIAVTAPTALSLPIGHQLSFTATGTFTDGDRDLTTQVTWDSSDPAVATISNVDGSRGVATGAAIGTTTITATFVQASGNVTGTTALTVTAAVVDSIAIDPLDASLPKGRHQLFTATATLSDHSTEVVTDQVTWESSDATVAQISNATGTNGDATAVGPGTTTIKATFVQPSGNVTQSTGLTVTDAVIDSITVAPAIASVAVTGTVQFTASGTFSDSTTKDVTAQVTWTSGDIAIAQIVPTTGLATGLALGTTTITATSGTVTSNAATLNVVPPNVVATLPRDTATGIRASTPIVVTFDQAMDPATLSTQTASGACSGTLQLSADDFATCVGFAAAAPTLSLNNTVATLTPASLQVAVTYKARVLGTVTSAGGAPLAATFTQAIGFTTAAPGSCASSLVISQVYGGGGNTGATLRNDFIELHNRGTAPVDLTGYAVQYAAAAGTTWQTQALPSVSVPPGGYFLVQEAAGTNTTLSFPTPDFIPANPISMSGTSGKVALTPSTTALSGACPLGLTNDFVGYGTATCFEGTGATAALTNTTAAFRNSGGCTDTDDNKTDVTAATAGPRNSATTLNVCACTP